MKQATAFKTTTHVVDILGNVVGRDQPIMLMEKAIELVSLLSEDVLRDENTVFFDPFCKAGEILLACVFMSCWAQTKQKGRLLDLDKVQKELYESKRYFALAPDERHHRLSLRTFLGNTQSHNQKFASVIRDGHYLSEIDGRLDREKFEKEFNSMIEYIKTTAKGKKIIAVGNPPYQENDGGFGGSAKAIYNLFTETLINCDQISEVVLVIPSRWFTTGKGVDEFRKRMIARKTIKSIHHFKYSKTVFPTVDVLGGVCFIHHQQGYKGELNFIEGSTETPVNLESFDIILDDPKGYEIVSKVRKAWTGKFVSEGAWTVRPFGIRTFYFARSGSLKAGDKNAIPCFSKRRKIQFANLKDIPKNVDRIGEWKLAVPSAYAPGSKIGVRRVTLPVDQYFIIPKGCITTETYNIVRSFKKESEAKNFLGYLQTNFARYMLGLRKVTQHVYKEQWNWVPLVDCSKPWTDEELYKLFKITKEEQKHIQQKLEEWS